MTQYYFDIETSGLDPKKDQLVAIAFQVVDEYTGKPIGQSFTLKEWTDGESFLIRKMESYGLLETGTDGWIFVPVGTNLEFDLSFCLYRSSMLGLRVWNQDQAVNYLRSKQRLDIQNVLRFLNGGKHKGSKLSDWSKIKTSSGDMIPQLWKDKKYAEIEAYIEMDRQAFFDVYGKIRSLLNAASNSWYKEETK